MRLTMMSTVAPAPLLVHILHIVGLCAEKQMPRVCARWVITFMEYEKSLWDRPLMYLPREPRHSHRRTLADHYRQTEYAIPLYIRTTPAPAFLRVTGFYHPPPVPSFNRDTYKRHRDSIMCPYLAKRSESAMLSAWYLNIPLGNAEGKICCARSRVTAFEPPESA